MSQKATLILGASTDASRYSNRAARMLAQHGHPIINVGREEGEVAGAPIYTKLPDDAEFDTVTMYLSAKRQGDYAQMLLDRKPRRVIFNPGAENPELEKTLEDAGIEPVHACTLVLLSTGQF